MSRRLIRPDALELAVTHHERGAKSAGHRRMRKMQTPSNHGTGCEESSRYGASTMGR